MKLLLIILLFTLSAGMYAQSGDSVEDYETAASYYNNGDYKTAFRYFSSAANAGNYNAQYDLGNLYWNGAGTEKNHSKAIEWYLKSANQGHYYAQNKLGDLYYSGDGVKQDYLKAYEWYLKSANKDHAAAQNMLGYMYNEGLGVNRDYMKAFEWYSKAAEQGLAVAQNNLAVLYYVGNGVNKDYMKAYVWFAKAAEQGVLDAQFSLGEMFYNGYGVQQDYMKAYEWYSKAANQGDPDAQNAIGDMYADGNGVNEDDNKAYEWYTKAANSGQIIAQYNLGVLYYSGQGCSKDYKKAYEWLSKAANSGNVDAQNLIAYMLEHGEGVAVNYTKAYELYLKASDGGSWKARNNLGRFFFYGIGVPKNYNKSESWFRKALEIEDCPLSLSFISLIYAIRDKNYVKALELSDSTINNKTIEEWDNEVIAAIYGHRGYIFYLKGDMADANKMLSKCLDYDSNFLESNNEFARIMVKKRRSSNLSDNDNYLTENINVDNKTDTDSEIFTSLVSNVNTFAIIIGNETYKNEANVLYAINDAKVFSEYVEKTLGVPRDHIKLVDNAGYNDLRIAVNWLIQAMKVCKGKGKAIVYYAGHGIPNEEDLSTYLLPVDGIGNDPESGFSLKSLYEKLSSVEAQSITIFLDACFSGSKREDGMLASARGVAIKVKPTIPNGNIIVFSAAQGNETAYPYKEKQHGLFTYFLLKKLKDSKGEVTLGELSDYLIDEVGREAFVKNGKVQTPSTIPSVKLGNTWRNIKLK